MDRIVFSGGMIFDGTGADPYPADPAVEGDRIVALGPALDGDRSAAELMGVEDELGSLEPGKLADIVLVDGDVYALADLASRVRAVWKGGQEMSSALAGSRD